MIAYLIRHGETDAVWKGLCGRRAGISLNEKGTQQARHIAAQLKHLPIAAIYSSPLERAMETAHGLAQAARLDVNASESWTEVDHGDWTGLSWSELEQDPRWLQYSVRRSTTGCPNGETALDVQSRAMRELNHLLDRHAGEQVAIFTHAGVISAVLCHCAAIPLDFSLRLEISPGSISTIEFSPASVRILNVNQAPQFC